MKDVDYYEVLEIDRDCSLKNIKDSYKNLAKKYHPDINKSHVAIEKFKQINEAYQVLSDPEHRKKYDKQYGQKVVSKPVKDFCNYYHCQKITITEKCEFCKKFYCKNHIIPHRPADYWTSIKKGIPDNIHPCVDCPPCRYCDNDWTHPKPYKGPYEKDPETEPPPATDKEPIDRLLHRVINVVTYKLFLTDSEVNEILSIDKELPDEKIGLKIVKIISEKSLSIVKNNPNSKKVILDGVDTIKHDLVGLSRSVFNKDNITQLEKAKKLIEEIKIPEPPIPTKPEPGAEGDDGGEEPPTKLVIITCVIILFLLIGIFLFKNYNKSEIKDIKLEEVKTTKIVYESIPINVSFLEYIDNKERYENSNLSLVGFLSYELEGSGNTGVYNEYILDDFSNKISLVNIPKQYKPLFVMKETSKELYNVSGIFKKRYKNAEIAVLSITPAARPIEQITKEAIA